MHALSRDHTALPPCAASAGLTLLEVLVALVILSVGLLGLAGLQAAGLRANGDAEQRTQAALIANDLVERMRANPAAVGAGQYAAIDWANLSCATAPDPFCADRATAAASCTPAQMAAFDAFIVRCGASEVLAGASVRVQCTDQDAVAAACTDTALRTLTVGWENTSTDTNTSKQIALTVRP